MKIILCARRVIQVLFTLSHRCATSSFPGPFLLALCHSWKRNNRDPGNEFLVFFFGGGGGGRVGVSQRHVLRGFFCGVKLGIFVSKIQDILEGIFLMDSLCLVKTFLTSEKSG